MDAMENKELRERFMRLWFGGFDSTIDGIVKQVFRSWLEEFWGELKKTNVETVENKVHKEQLMGPCCAGRLKTSVCYFP